MRPASKFFGFISCAGAGGLVALHFDVPWPIGMFLSGIATYIVYNFQIWSDIRYTYRHVVAWKPHTTYWKAVGAMFLGYFALTSSMLTAACLSDLISNGTTAGFVPVSVCALIIDTVAAFTVAALQNTRDHAQHEYRLKKRTWEGLYMVFWTNPITLSVLFLIGTARGIRMIHENAFALAVVASLNVIVRATALKDSVLGAISRHIHRPA